tara:strand:+ start:619 stop:999 length:381 start_codon:yes stop_codon:yes gene_type:complete
MVKQQMTLDGYSKNELIHIVEMYNIGLDMDTLRKSKGELLKEMKKVPKKKYVDLPDKKTVKDMVTKDKSKKSSLLNKVVNDKSKITNYVKPEAKKAEAKKPEVKETEVKEPKAKRKIKVKKNVKDK